MAWGWLTMTSSLLLKVAVAPSVERLQKKKESLWQLIMTTRLVRSGAFSAPTVTTDLSVVTAGIWGHITN